MRHVAQSDLCRLGEVTVERHKLEGGVGHRLPHKAFFYPCPRLSHCSDLNPERRENVLCVGGAVPPDVSSVNAGGQVEVAYLENYNWASLSFLALTNTQEVWLCSRTLIS